jgi:hypothetical protein
MARPIGTKNTPEQNIRISVGRSGIRQTPEHKQRIAETKALSRQLREAALAAGRSGNFDEVARLANLLNERRGH